MAVIKGRIFKIQRYSIHDGPGIRTTIFLQGCPLQCRWCHNPESQPYEAATARTITVDALIREIEQDTIFFDHSQGGVTFSGGEPLAQPEFLTALLKECREREIHTAVDTSGFAPAHVMEQAATLCDLVLFDLKPMDHSEHRQYTGVSLQPVLDNLALLQTLDVDLRLRLPLIPDITATENNLDRLMETLSANNRFRTLDLLPFHRTGAAKYKRLGIPDPMAGTPEPKPELVAKVKEILITNGFIVSEGG
ncbi:MAG: glycyl-radical enzyme activating protein [Desulfobacteraceae bacterium]|nr:glycyl-radical enzyme activating protein [Desulfobacteraceae bacterium]